MLSWQTKCLPFPFKEEIEFYLTKLISDWELNWSCLIVTDVCSVMSYTLLLSLIEYKTLVLRGDFQRAQEVLPTIPKEHLNR
jgi:hypothetical protein